MNFLRACRAFGAAFALVILGAVAQHVLAVLPTPQVQGPFLGDQFTNIYSLQQAINFNNQQAFTATLSVSQTSGQANCTQLSNNPVVNVSTSASTGYICLPFASGGRVVYIGNAAGQTINIYSSATSFVSGTADTINGTAGTTAYAGLTSGKNAICFTPANGTWNCLSGS